MDNGTTYQHLEPRPGSLYRQPFIKGTRIRAEIPYGYTVDKEDEEDGLVKGDTPEEVAEYLHVPLAAVLEAIDYCRHHWDVVIADHAREDRLMEAHGMNHPDYKLNPKKHYRRISIQEWVRIINDENLP